MIDKKRELLEAADRPNEGGIDEIDRATDTELFDVTDLPTRLVAIFAGLLLAWAIEPCPVARADALSIADTRRVFVSWEEWHSAYDEFVAAIAVLSETSSKPIETADSLLELMEAHERVYRIGGTVEGYIYLRLQLSSADEEALSRQHLLDATDRSWSTVGAPSFSKALTDLGHDQIGEWLARRPALRRYGFFFRRFFEGAGHPYPEGLEQLRNLADISRRQSTRVHRALAVTEAPHVEVILESGEPLAVKPAPPRTVLGGLSSATDRRAVDKAWLESLGRQSQTYAALLEGIVEHENLIAEVRAFDSALSSRLHSDAIPAETVRSMIRAARESSAPLRRYHSLRKEILALEEYGLADRFLPLGTADLEAERQIGFEEARKLIVDASSALGPQVQELVRRAFSERWIDSIERPGKRPNAGSTFVAGHPYVIVRYRGSVENLFQLAHEIGHAVHALLAYRAQPFVYSHRSSLTSEAVASVFEGVLVDHMVGPSTNREEQIQVLDLSIQTILRLFYRPMLDADFELRLYETDLPITGQSLGARYLDVVADFYGETVTLNDWDAHGWQRTPHFFTSPLYLGRYGLASAAANLLVPKLTSPVDSEAASAREAFLDLLQAGSSDYPLELLRRAGADLAEPEAIELLTARMESLVAQLIRAADAD